MKIKRILKKEVKSPLLFDIMKVLLILSLIILIPNMVADHNGYYFAYSNCETGSMSPTFDCNEVAGKQYSPLILYKRLHTEEYSELFQHDYGDFGVANYTIVNPQKIKQELEIGDIIVFYHEGYGLYVLHRIVDRCEVLRTDKIRSHSDNYDNELKILYEGVITRGDNNDGDDGCILYQNIYAKVVGWFPNNDLKK